MLGSTSYPTSLMEWVLRSHGLVELQVLHSPHKPHLHAPRLAKSAQRAWAPEKKMYPMASLHPGKTPLPVGRVSYEGVCLPNTLTKALASR